MVVWIASFFLGETYADGALTWKECVKEAARNHPDLISAEESVKQSEAAKKITASALFPQVDSSLSASTAKASSSGKAADTYSYGVTGNQLVFDGTKTINNVRAATENMNAARYNYKFTSSEVRLRLRTAFVNLLKAQELIRIAEEIHAIRKSNVELITLRYSSGMEHRGALLTAQANLAEATFEIAHAKRGLEVAQRQLIKELGEPRFFPVQAGGDLTVKELEGEKPDFEAIVRAHPSLLGLAAKINQASFSLNAAHGSFFPQLSAQAGAGRTNSRWPPRNDQWDLGLVMTVPVFEGGLRNAQLSQAQSVLRQAEAGERIGHDALVAALEQSWAALLDAAGSVEVQNKFLIAAQERAKIAEAQYSLGTITYDNWTIIEDDLVSAKKSFLNTQANALLAEANWVQAKGETLEYEL